MPNDKVVIPKNELEVNTLLGKLKMALDNGDFKIKARDEDGKSYLEVTSVLFPDKDPVEGIKEELGKLTIEEFIEVMEHNKNKSQELWVFGRNYSGRDVYIKFTVTLFKNGCNHETYVFSFHWAKWEITEDQFKFRKT